MITRYLSRNPQLVWLLMLSIVIAGIACFLVMPRLEDPILGQRVGVITATLPGADPTEMESTVTIPIEQWLESFTEIKKVRSNTRSNITNIVVELEDRITDTVSVWSSIENDIQLNHSELPEGTSLPRLSVFPLKAFAAIVAIKPGENSSLTPFQLRRITSELESQIRNLDGTESVQRFGDPGEEISIEVPPDVLAATGLSVGGIAAQILESKSAPAGDHDQSGTRLVMELDEESSDDPVKALADVSIRQPETGESVLLSDLAVVERQTVVPKLSEAIIDGQAGIVLGVFVKNESRVDLWAERYRNLESEFRAEFNADYEIDQLFMQSDHVKARMSRLLKNLGISALAVVTLVLLLMGWRCMIVVAVSLPLSALLVVCGLRILEIPIHQMSVTGLIVALGLLIDNAIVMVEEVRSRIFAGAKPLVAVTDSVKHLGMPLFGSTLTTVLAFLPIATMPGPSGEFVGSIAVSVILAIVASFVLAITVIPALVLMLGVNSKRTSFLEYGFKSRLIERAYLASLRFVFRFPEIGILLGVLLPVTGFVSAQFIDKQFFPASDRSQLQIELEMQASSTVESLRESVDQVQQIVDDDSRVERLHWFLGESAPTFYYNVVPRRRQTPSYAQAFVDVQPGANIDQLINQLQQSIDASVHDARVIVRKLEQGPPFDAPIEVRIVGEDQDLIEGLGNEVRQLLTQMDEVTHTRSDLGDTVPKLSMNLDDAMMRQRKISKQELSRFLYSSLEGVSAGNVFESGEQIPVRVKVDFSNRSVIKSLMAMRVVSENGPPSVVPSGSGQPGPPSAGQRAAGGQIFGALGEFELASDVGAIIRLNGNRVNEVKAYLKTGVLPSVVLERFKSNLRDSSIVVPNDCQIEFGGEDEKRSQAVATLVSNSVILVAIMVVALVAVLGSFRAASIIALVGGLAIGLGPLALSVFGFPFGFMAIVGTMGLVGVAINDSIVVLAAIESNSKKRQLAGDSTEPDASSEIDESENGNERPKELAEVVFGCTRHILATTLTTMVGFSTLVLDGGKFWPPLAIVISAGVGGATILALYFVPSVYCFLFPSARKNSRTG